MMINITPMDYKALQNTLSDYSKALGLPVLWYDASKIRILEAAGDTAKINTIWTWYEGFMSDPLLSEFKNSTYGTLRYSSITTAQSNAEDWFPIASLCPDADHYVYACIFNESGNLAWENVG